MAWKRKIILINLAFVWSCNIGAYHNHCNFVLYMYMRTYAYTNHMSVNLPYSVHTAPFVLQRFGCFRQVIQLWVRCNICHWRVEGWQIRNQQCRQIKRHGEIENVNRAIAQYFGTCLFFRVPSANPWCCLMLLCQYGVDQADGLEHQAEAGSETVWSACLWPRTKTILSQAKRSLLLSINPKKRTWQWQDKRTHTLTLQRNHVSTCPVRWCKFSGGNRLSPVWNSKAAAWETLLVLGNFFVLNRGTLLWFRHIPNTLRGMLFGSAPDLQPSLIS